MNATPKLARGLIAAVFVAFAIGGCRVGPTGRALPVARGPHGATVRVGSFQGELLAARDDGLVLLETSRRVLLISYTALPREITVARVVRVRPGGPPPPLQMRRLRAVSRFPQGIPSAYMERLLRESGQDGLVVLQ